MIKADGIRCSPKDPTCIQDIFGLKRAQVPSASLMLSFNSNFSSCRYAAMLQASIWLACLSVSLIASSHRFRRGQNNHEARDIPDKAGHTKPHVQGSA